MRTKCVWVIASITALNLLSARAEWIDVKNWSSNPSLNAVGNGIVNDAPAIQAAINSLTNGATLYFPAGTYLLNATINTGTDFWTDLALHLTQPNVTLKGDGPGSVLLQSDCRTTLLYADFKSITNSDNVAGLTIDGLKFQGDVSGPYYSNGVSTASGGLIACAGPASRAKKIILKNVFTNDQGKRAAIYLESLDDVLIESCTFIHYSKTNATMGPGFPTIFVAPAGVGSLRVVNNHYDGGTTLQNWAS